MTPPRTDVEKRIEEIRTRLAHHERLGLVESGQYREDVPWLLSSLTAALAERDAAKEERKRLFDLGVQTDDELRVFLYGADWGHGRTHQQRFADLAKLKARMESAEAKLAEAEKARDAAFALIPEHGSGKAASS